jgi:NAD(P)-dependent dehydrogenase (short-subunit alcohol dehydrogenase family)
MGANVSGVQDDIAKLADLERLYKMVFKMKGQFDIVFANAGVGEFVPFWGRHRRTQKSPRSRQPYYCDEGKVAIRRFSSGTRTWREG